MSRVEGSVALSDEFERWPAGFQGVGSRSIFAAPVLRSPLTPVVECPMNHLSRKAAGAGACILMSIALLTFPARAQTNWAADPGNPVIPNTLTEGYALTPSVLYDRESGLYRMWFTAHPIGGSWAIDYAVSPDGIHWFAYAKNPVLTGGAMPFEASGVVYAGVVYDGTQYRMYYTGLQGCCGSAVGLATSPDGIIWTKYPGNPILRPSAGGWDSGNIGASSGVYYDGSTYYLLYQGVASSAAYVYKGNMEASAARMTVDAASSQQIGLATSTDGVTFSKSASNPVIPRGGAGAWDEAGVFPGGIFVRHGVFYAFYAGAPSNLSKESLGLATSNNGVTWTKAPHNPLFGGVSSWDWNIGSGTPVLRDGTIQLWYAGNSDGGNEWSIGFATAPFEPELLATGSWTDAPARPMLQLLGAQPNPTPGVIVASFVLPTRGRVSLELFDLAGRRILSREDLDLSSGSHLLPLIPEGRTAPGVYLLRMGFEGKTLESRVVFAR